MGRSDAGEASAQPAGRRSCSAAILPADHRTVWFDFNLDLDFRVVTDAEDDFESQLNSVSKGKKMNL